MDFCFSLGALCSVVEDADADSDGDRGVDAESLPLFFLDFSLSVSICSGRINGMLLMMRSLPLLLL